MIRGNSQKLHGAGWENDPDRRIDALVYDLYLSVAQLRQAGILRPAKIKIAKGVIA